MPKYALPEELRIQKAQAAVIEDCRELLKEKDREIRDLRARFDEAQHEVARLTQAGIDIAASEAAKNAEIKQLRKLLPPHI